MNEPIHSRRVCAIRSGSEEPINFGIPSRLLLWLTRNPFFCIRAAGTHTIIHVRVYGKEPGCLLPWFFIRLRGG